LRANLQQHEVNPRIGKGAEALGKLGRSADLANSTWDISSDSLKAVS
jgi:hypothetical protein